MRRFYFCSSDRVGDKVRLDRGEARHLSVVIRARKGRRVVLFNEKGEEFIALVGRITPRRVELSIVEKMGAVSRLPGILHLAMAVVKGKALERVLSGATELGVGKIILVRCGRSVPRIPPADIGKKLARWKKIVLSAAKQCGRTDCPSIEYLSGWNELIGSTVDYDGVFIAREAGRRGLPSIDRGNRVLVVVGPEGGLTGAEESAAVECGALPLCLGPYTLRSDTAAIAALALIANSFSIQNISATKTQQNKMS